MESRDKAIKGPETFSGEKKPHSCGDTGSGCLDTREQNEKEHLSLEQCRS